MITSVIPILFHIVPRFYSNTAMPSVLVKVSKLGKFTPLKLRLIVVTSPD